MDEPLVYIDHSVIKPGMVAEVTSAVTALVQFVREREPQLLAYSFHVDSVAMTMAVVAVHPNPDSLELHLQIGGPEFRKVGEFIELRLIEVYGEPGPTIREMLAKKAEALGPGARVVIYERSVGFARFAPEPRR